MTIKLNLKLWVRSKESDRGYTMIVRRTRWGPDMSVTVGCLVNFKRDGDLSPFQFIMNADGTFEDGTGRPLIVKRYKREEYTKHCASMVT